MTEKVLFTWSGGKDSALALYELRKAGNFRILALLTTVTKDYDRISMHGVRRTLLQQQAESLGYCLEEVPISKSASNEEYEARMRETLQRYVQAGVRLVAFGDVVLEEVRRHREENLSRMGMTAAFPLWGRDTAELARTFIALGFKAVVTCVDSSVLDRGFVGRPFDERFLSELPPGVDPSGENGEFHTFVYDGPIFREGLSCVPGVSVCCDNRFVFCDLIPRS